MNNIIDIDYFNSLSIKKIKENVKEIKELLPKEEQNIITYSKNFTLSLSNYCQNFCGYCFYNYKVPKINVNANIILLNNDQLTTLIQKAISYNCKEALLMSGERPDSFEEVKKELDKRNCSDYIEFIKDICTNLLNLNILPHINIGLLTYEELKDLKNYSASMGLMLESTSMELFKKGGVHEFSPGKLPENRIRHLEDAGKLKVPFTTGLLLGIGETFENRVNDLYLIKKIHENYGHIQEVIIQNFVYKEGIKYHPENTLSIEDILKITGIAKLILENEIAVQVPPNLISGFEKDFIEMGIDDFGGISPFTIDYINPDMSWPQIDDINQICKKLDYVLKERFPIYDKFIKKSEFCPVSIKKRIESFI
jgi:FO synthase subunit 1